MNLLTRGSRGLTGSRHWIPITLALAVATLVLGLWGYLRTEGLADSAYDTLRLFSLGGQGVGDGPWQLQVARFLAPLTTVVLAVEALVLIFRDEIERWRIGLSRRHVVVCGLGRSGVQLVESLGRQRRRVVAIERDPAGPGLAASRAGGALVATGDATSAAILRRARADRADAVVAVCGDDEANVEIAAVVERIAGGDVPVTVLAAVEDEELHRALSERALLARRGQGTSVEFVSIAQRAARATLRRHPLAEPGAPAPGGIGVVVVGLGPRGAALVLAAARQARLLGGEPGGRLAVTVVDADATGRVAALAARHPRLERVCELRAVDAAPGTSSFEGGGFIEPPPDRVYVCMEDDISAVSAGLAIARRLDGRDAPVVVQVSSLRDSAGRFLAPDPSADPLAPGMHLVGVVEETFTPELLFDHVTETVARALHEEYLREGRRAARSVDDSPYMVSWEHLPETAREESRAHARDIGAKLAAIGRRVRSVDDAAGDVPTLSTDETELLAELEHERWMRSRIAAGWSLGPRDDHRLRHPDLVPWAELPEPRRDIDRAFARALPELLARAGFIVEAAG